MTPINTIKNWFTTGSKPTQTQFWQVFDSYRHKSEAIPMQDVSGLNNALANKADVSMLNLKANKDATGLSGNNILSWKEALGIADLNTDDFMQKEEYTIGGLIRADKIEALGLTEIFKANENTIEDFAAVSDEYIFEKNDVVGIPSTDEISVYSLYFYIGGDKNDVSNYLKTGVTQTPANDNIFISVTKTEISDLIANENLIPGALYEIKGVDVNLYGGTDIYIYAVSNKELKNRGYGKFYNHTSSIGYSLKNAYYTYNVYVHDTVIPLGTKVSWGFYMWKKINNLRPVANPIDKFTMNPEDWEKIEYNDVDYDVVYDEIQYSIEKDLIYNRKDVFRNAEVRFDQDFIENNSLEHNPIKMINWGYYFKDSLLSNTYFESISVTGTRIINSKLTDCFIQNNDFEFVAQDFPGSNPDESNEGITILNSQLESVYIRNSTIHQNPAYTGGGLPSYINSYRNEILNRINWAGFGAGAIYIENSTIKVLNINDEKFVGMMRILDSKVSNLSFYNTTITSYLIIKNSQLESIEESYIQIQGLMDGVFLSNVKVKKYLIIRSNTDDDYVIDMTQVKSIEFFDIDFLDSLNLSCYPNFKSVSQKINSLNYEYYSPVGDIDVSDSHRNSFTKFNLNNLKDSKFSSRGLCDIDIKNSEISLIDQSFDNDSLLSKIYKLEISDCKLPYDFSVKNFDSLDKSNKVSFKGVISNERFYFDYTSIPASNVKISSLNIIGYGDLELWDNTLFMLLDNYPEIISNPGAKYIYPINDTPDYVLELTSGLAKNISPIMLQ